MGASACLQAVCWMQGPPSHRQCLDLPFASKTTASAAVVRTLKHGHSVNFVRRQWHGMATQSSRGRLRPASENHRVVQRGRKFALEASN